jgi:toxin-antitoxin system PIN domain toxin
LSTYLFDTSVWIALSIQTHVHNRMASTWFETIVEPASALFCRATQQSVLRLLTTAAVMARYGLGPLSNDQAWEVLDSLLRDERVDQVLEEPPGLARFWREFSARQTSSPNVWMDAYLAAFARAAGYELVTIDGGFRQYRGLAVVVLEERALP